jgi:hypothetical protein
MQYHLDLVHVGDGAKMRVTAVLLLWKHLPWIHNPVGVEQFLDLFHPFDARSILAISQCVRFGVSDPMFCRDRSVV